MLSLSRKSLLEGLFIVLLGLPFFLLLDPFPRDTDGLYLIYGNFGVVPIIDGFNNLFEIIVRPIGVVLSIGMPKYAGLGAIYFYVRNVFIYAVVVTLIGMIIIFLAERVISWKIPVSILFWITVSILTVKISMAQTDAITLKRNAINDQLGSLIQVSVQRCSLRAGELADQQIITCDLVASNLPTNAQSSSSGRPLIDVYYSHPKQVRNNDSHRWPDDAFVNLEMSDTITLSPDRTTATFQSETAINDPAFKPEDFYISAIEYHVGFDNYSSDPMHIPLRQAFRVTP